MPACDFTLRHGCSPVNLLHVFRTPFLKLSSGWLLLYLRENWFNDGVGFPGKLSCVLCLWPSILHREDHWHVTYTFSVFLIYSCLIWLTLLLYKIFCILSQQNMKPYEHHSIRATTGGGLPCPFWKIKKCPDCVYA